MPCSALAAALAALLLALAGAAQAQAQKPAAPKNDQPPAEHVFGGWGGLRTGLRDRGIDLTVDYEG